MNFNVEKSLFRKECLNKLKVCSTKNRQFKNSQINKKILFLTKYLKAKKVLIYAPLSLEANLNQLLKFRSKFSFYTPFMVGTSFKIVQYRLPLFEKNFGILEPSDSFKKAEKIDIAIVPIVGMDRDFKRIGFGKGMFDRFFSSLNYKPIIVFVQMCQCLSQIKLSESFDIKADFYITDKKFLYVRGCKYGNRVLDCRRYFCSNKCNCDILYNEKAKYSQLQYILRTSKSKSKSYRA